MLPQVEVVVINWKRPANLAKIVTALRQQTVPCTITICDCHPSFRYSLSRSTKAKADRIFRWKHNLGAFSRYVPLAAFDHPYTLLIDDDMLPGSRCIEYFLACAEQQPTFGVLGQLGRMATGEGEYIMRNVKRSKYFEPVDFIVRGYFVETRNLHLISRFRWHLNYFEEERPEDDLLLCGALRFYEDLPCYLLPQNEDRETLINKIELEARHALCKRPEHHSKRTEFVQRMLKAGWQPLAHTIKDRPLQSIQHH